MINIIDFNSRQIENSSTLLLEKLKNIVYKLYSN